VSVWPIGQIESLFATLDFAGQEGKIDLFARAIVRLLGGFDIEFPPLYLCEVGPLESISVVRLRAWSIERDRLDPQVVVTFYAAAKFFSPTDAEVFGRWDNERM
jgi:hypothetical protein